MASFIEHALSVSGGNISKKSPKRLFDEWNFVKLTSNPDQQVYL